MGILSTIFGKKEKLVKEHTPVQAEGEAYWTGELFHLGQKVKHITGRVGKVVGKQQRGTTTVYIVQLPKSKFLLHCLASHLTRG